MKVIIGLGNPGGKYIKSRHNIGWMIIDELKARVGADDFKENKKFKALITETNNPNDKNDKLILVKPLTFMNLSGETVATIKSFFKLSSEDLIVVYDDIDLPLGELRFRSSGGPGTHNGMRSIVQHIGEDFPRLRFGIENRPEDLKSKIDLSDYVLGGFAKHETEIIENKISESIETIFDRIKT
ncbi:MAG: aminoacyl-tRNA hydrolase [Candidatus Peregrinibacteria bacterium]|nr:aminoacyl-tRNA hydrolase [Candidatus Peregrinibacteria bacterium]MDZ4245079.1 aminoacyl-tRNA hydrolase [Candidatus Gracilibacteria bacterium]